jgi:hemerythrin
MQSNFRASKLVLSLDVMQFLKDWLSGHILTHDKAYAKELLSHN